MTAIGVRHHPRGQRVVGRGWRRATSRKCRCRERCRCSGGGRAAGGRRHRIAAAGGARRRVDVVQALRAEWILPTSSLGTIVVESLSIHAVALAAPCSPWRCGSWLRSSCGDPDRPWSASTSLRAFCATASARPSSASRTFRVGEPFCRISRVLLATSAFDDSTAGRSARPRPDRRRASPSGTPLLPRSTAAAAASPRRRTCR